MSHYDVYGIGNALVDIQAHVSDDFLTTLISEHHPGAGPHVAKGAMHLVTTEFQGHLLRLLESHELHTISGGSACNTMIGIAQMGCPAKYAGKVGDDVYGAFYAEDLHKIGVHFDVTAGTDPTGTCIILITPDAQRTMFTHLGISTQLSPSDINEADIQRAKWVYIEGYLWDAAGPKAASLKVMELAKRHGVKVAYTFSDPFCVRRARDDFRRFTQEFVDLVFCNEEEGFSFTDTDDVHAALHAIEQLGTAVAFTRSAHGSIIAWHGERHAIPAVLVKPLDSTGAGDLYAAGMLAGLCRGHTPLHAGQLASRLAAEVIAVQGPRLAHDFPADALLAS